MLLSACTSSADSTDKAATDIATLSDIALSNGATLSPAFDPATTNYTVALGYNATGINGDESNANAPNSGAVYIFE